MTAITIPKNITRGDELVVIPKKDYEKLLKIRSIPEFYPTASERKDLIRARKNRARGNFLTINELKAKLGFRN